MKQFIYRLEHFDNLVIMTVVKNELNNGDIQGLYNSIFIQVTTRNCSIAKNSKNEHFLIDLGTVPSVFLRRFETKAKASGFTSGAKLAIEQAITSLRSEEENTEQVPQDFISLNY